MSITKRNIACPFGCVIVLALTQAAFPVSSAHGFAGGPRTFNQYVTNDYPPGYPEKLARYDVLALDAETPASVLTEIRSFNPQIKILAFIPINGIYERAYLLPEGSATREEYEAAEAGNWWLRDTHGGHVHDWPMKYSFNLTVNCPPNTAGQTIIDWFPQFIVNRFANSGGSWDGVFLDDVWVSISYANDNGLNPYPIDTDQDGVADDPLALNRLWRAANDTITARARRLMPSDKILIGNGQNPFYHLNGAMLENFPFWGHEEGSPLGYTWNDRMFGLYGYFNDDTYYSDAPARVNVVNTQWDQGDRLNPVRTPEYERRKRFCLVSSMLRDGYFSMDEIDHCSIWWEPEYEKQIGTPLGAPYQATYNGMTLWRREYTNGSVILNSNYTTFMGSAADHLPPIGWLDARILLNSEMWNPESVPPAAVNDLAVTATWNDRAEIRWTQVGDDGTSGQAVEVQARYSLSPINDANWGVATIGAASLLPDLPGTVGTAVLTGLTQGTLYYFAVKTRDMSGNWSAVSNCPGAVTVISDLTAPSAVSDLAVSLTTPTSVMIDWSAPGDDGPAGTASAFDLRFATFQIDSTNFNNAMQVVDEPTPAPAGTPQEYELESLLPGRTYYFAIRTGDEMPNWSAVSNIASLTTPAGDTTPPATITDLHVSAVGAGWVTLQWTAPGNDGMTGRATLYDVRWGLTEINLGNWFGGSNQLAGEPMPALAGAVQSFTISGLDLSRTYYFAMRTADEYPNWSGVSNPVMATTSPSLPTLPAPDITSPASITNLTVDSKTTNSITLSWTAPGDDGVTGGARTYDLRYSKSPIVGASFGLAVQAAGEPSPGTAGTRQTFTVDGLTASTTYYFAIKAADEIPNWSGLSNTTNGTTATTTPDTEPPLPFSALSAAAPNPFRNDTRVTLEVPAEGASDISLKVFDVGGRFVRTLLHGDLPAGPHEISWDGRDAGGRTAPAGIYFLVLSGDRVTGQRKVVRKP